MADKPTWEPRKPFVKKLTWIWLGLVLLTILIFYRPGCEKGSVSCDANTNTVMYLVFLYVILPLSLLLIGLWGLIIYYKLKK